MLKKMIKNFLYSNRFAEVIFNTPAGMHMIVGPLQFDVNQFTKYAQVHNASQNTDQAWEYEEQKDEDFFHPGW